MSVQVLGPPPLNTKLKIDQKWTNKKTGQQESRPAELDLGQQLPLAKWLNLIHQILEGVGPQLRASAVLDFPNTAAQTSSDLTIAVDGADFTADPPQRVSLGSPAPPANSSYSAFVSAADVVTVRFLNASAAGINPASGTFSVIVHN